MFRWLAESIWGYPIIAAIHVLAMAWFGGLVLTSDLRRLKWFGLAVLLSTGFLLFALQPAVYAGSWSFRIKMLLLVLIPFSSSRALALTLWVAVIFASRFTAFV